MWLFTVIDFPPFIYIFTKVRPSGKGLNGYSFIRKKLGEIVEQEDESRHLQDHLKITRLQIYPSLFNAKSSSLNNYLNPLKAGNSLARQISSQLLSCSQVGSGFFSALLRLTPPVKRNISSWWSTSCFALSSQNKDCCKLLILKLNNVNFCFYSLDKIIRTDYPYCYKLLENWTK